MPLTLLPDWPAVGERVALARRTLGLTQADLATRIALDRTALAKVETGNRHRWAAIPARSPRAGPG